MRKELEKAIRQFKESKTSLDSYQAISAFVKVVLEFPDFISQIEKEGEDIRKAQFELSKDKGWNYGLKGSELRDHSDRRGQKSEALHQLDPIFPLRNLHNVHLGIQPENISNNSDWLFHRFGPDEPLPEMDKKEYGLFLEKIYKRILPILNEKETIEFGFDSEKSLLYLEGLEIPISLKNDKTNAHYILKHIFDSGDLNQEFPFSEISEDTFKDAVYKWNKFYRACQDIERKVWKYAKIDDFLEFTSGKTGWVKINKKYLK